VVELLISLTGELLFTAELSPNLPHKLNPQLQRVPSVFTAAVCRKPADTQHQVVELVISLTGELLLLAVPSPNCPHMFNPQLQRVPPVLSATAC
jgi:hypothetical protein